MKRRRALQILGTAVGAPLVIPRAGFAEIVEWARDVRAGMDSVGDRQERTLTEAQNSLVTAIAEVIIPQTDTPGAKVAGIDEFIDVIVTGWLDEDEKNRFLDGIDTVDALSNNKYGRNFTDCSTEEKMAIVAKLDTELDELRRDSTFDETAHFFYDMKRFTLAGYFTSETGLRTLGYRIVPGAFEGCVLLDQYGVGGGR